MENEKEVVRGSKATAEKVIIGHEIIRQNRRLGERITILRKEAGYSSSDFYALLYPDSKEKPSVKAKRMGEIERGNVGQKGAKVIDFPRLAFIASFCHAPLEWLLYGEEKGIMPKESTAPNQEGDAGSIEDSEKFSSENEEEIKKTDVAVASSDSEILENEGYNGAFLSIANGLFDLMQYADIEITSDTDLPTLYSDLRDNSAPKEISLKIRPKGFAVHSLLTSEKQLSEYQYGIDGAGADDLDGRSVHVLISDEDMEYFIDSSPLNPVKLNKIEDFFIWDTRATFFQMLLVHSCLAKQFRIFSRSALIHEFQEYLFDNDYWIENDNWSDNVTMNHTLDELFEYLSTQSLRTQIEPTARPPIEQSTSQALGSAITPAIEMPPRPRLSPLDAVLGYGKVVKYGQLVAGSRFEKTCDISRIKFKYKWC